MIGFQAYLNFLKFHIFINRFYRRNIIFAHLIASNIDLMGNSLASVTKFIL